jgi:hypothetical protein
MAPAAILKKKLGGILDLKWLAVLLKKNCKSVGSERLRNANENEFRTSKMAVETKLVF